MSLPTLIAGPIIRRVEPSSVTVWSAFSKKQFVQLVLWDNLTEAKDSSVIPQEGFYVKSNPIETFEIADKLHISVATIDTSQKKLQDGTAYYYNLYFGDSESGLNNDFATSKLLDPPEETDPLLKAYPLGYDVGRLPTIVLPGVTLETLHVIHGSCRKIHGIGDEAFRHVDTILRETFDDLPEQKDVTKRPQQLFLTGDQIYADEIPQLVLPFINSLGAELFKGVKEQMVFVNSSASTEQVPVDMIHFPPNCRQKLINESGKLTGNGIASHLLSFQEYCSTYLHYWSRDVWNKELKLMLSKYRKSVYNEEVGLFHYYYLVNLLKDLDIDKMFLLLFKFKDDADKELKNKEIKDLLAALKTRVPPEMTEAQKAMVQKWTENYNSDPSSKFTGFEGIVKVMQIAQSLEENLKKRLESIYSPESVLEESRSSCDFLECLPLACRVLANIPTYMIFDDHEITDDWNFSQFWKNRAYTSPIGTQIVRNGLMAYTIFQDWGNVPAEYPQKALGDPLTTDDHDKYLKETGLQKGNKVGLLKKIGEYGKSISAGSAPERPGELANLLDTLLVVGEKAEEGKLSFVTPVRWHYNFPTGTAQTFVLDTRTQREFDDFSGSPGLLTQQALDIQLPERIADMNYPVVFVISPVPALSATVMEEFAQPLVGMIEGASSEEGVGGAPVGALSGALKRDMEAWSFSEKHLERLLSRLAKFKKVVILSGDVHYGFTTFADYWKERKVENHARIIQLTSSSFKNGWALEFVLLKSGFAQRLLGGFDFKFEKHGWLDKTLEINGDMAPRHRMRLRRNPIVLPRDGWNTKTTITPVEPDWAWVMQVAVDQTIFENNPLFPDLHFEVEKDLVEENQIGDPEEVKKTLLQMASRHNALFKIGRNRRLIWQPHIGHVFFSFADEAKTRRVLNHEFHYTCRMDGLLNNDTAADTDRNVLVSGPFTLHSVDLDVLEEDKIPPENLNTEAEIVST